MFLVLNFRYCWHGFVVDVELGPAPPFFYQEETHCIRSYNESPLGKKREEQAQVQHQQRNHVNNTENSKQETTNGDTNDKSSDE